jgi:hypothetical protein
MCLGFCYNVECWGSEVRISSGGRLFMLQPCGADFRGPHMVCEAVEGRLIFRHIPEHYFRMSILRHGCSANKYRGVRSSPCSQRCTVKVRYDLDRRGNLMSC